MCTLTEPAPSIFMDWLHPVSGALLIPGSFITFLFGFMLAWLWSTADSKDTWLSRKQAALFMLGGYVCMVVVFYWVGLFGSYGSDLNAWYQRELSLLSQTCASTVLTPAYETARNALQQRSDVGAVVLFVLGWLCVGVASWSRNMRSYILSGDIRHHKPQD